MSAYCLDVHEVGQGDPVVIFNGPGGLASHYFPLAKALSANYRVLIPCFPGDGSSAVYSDAAYSMDLDLALVEAALHGRGLESAHFIGFSGGVYRAFAAAASGRIAARSVVALGGYIAMPDDMRESMRAFARLIRAHELPGEALIPRMLAPAFAAANAKAAQEIAGWVSGQAAEGLAQQLDAFATCVDLSPQLGHLRAPVCVRAGELDVAVPPALSRRIIDAVPHARLELVAGVAHALLAEDFEETLRSIRGVISSA
jgi:3-oxoadipate enol-lactonase